MNTLRLSFNPVRFLDLNRLNREKKKLHEVSTHISTHISTGSQHFQVNPWRLGAAAFRNKVTGVTGLGARVVPE